VFLATLAVFLLVPMPRDYVEAIFFACWTTVIVTAASVYFVQRFGRWLPIVMSLNAGAWASAVVDISGSRLDVVKAFPCVLLALPASWIAERIGLIPIKVISSWFIAVATLAAVLQLLPVTPGYLPDHLE